MIKVKICGITRLEDALLAIKLGASALGFNFYKRSKRYINPDSARNIINQLPESIDIIGVFVNEDQKEVERIANFTKAHTIQLHGTESIEYCKYFNKPLIKAIHLMDDSGLILVKNFAPYCKILIDAPDLEQYGGTGALANHSLAKKAQAITPIMLSGGLSQLNIIQSINDVRPSAIDLCSSIEVDNSPGIKDHEKMRVFFTKLKGIES